jgi:hypothetical protein
MSQAWLSYDKAPPIWLPTGFFLAAMLWLAGAAILLAGGSMNAAERFHPQVLALTHLLALGVLGNIMIGALLQLLAVLAGVPVARPRRLMLAIFLPWQAGVFALAGGFARGIDPDWLQCGAAALALALLTLLWHAGLGLWRSPARDPGSRGMARALLGLGVAAGLGLTLVATLGGHLALPFLALLDAHVVWAGIGWLLLLLVAISQTVVPMFLITPAYPRPVAWIAAAALPLLLADALQTSLPPLAGVVLDWGLWLLVTSWAVLTLRLLQGSRRQDDPARRQWQLAMLYLILAAGCAMAARYLPAQRSLPLLAGLLWLGGLGLGVMFAMLGKIVPFLAWLHLKARKPPRGLLPSTHGFLSERAQTRLGLAHALWLVCGAGWCLAPAIFQLPFAAASALLALHALRLAYVIARLYARIGQQIGDVADGR